MINPRILISGLILLALAACGDKTPEAPAEPPPPSYSAATAAIYGPMFDDGKEIPAVPANLLSDDKARQVVDYWSNHKPGTIIVDPYAYRLYQVMAGNKAMRYTVGVGREGYGYTGDAHIPYQRNWPRWQPTQGMIERNPELYADVAKGVEGGLNNPMGARALYMHNSGGDTLYRIHGTMDPRSVGTSWSSGCIRLYNQDIIHLARNTSSMTKVVVLKREESGLGTVPPGQPLPEPPPINNPSEAEFIASDEPGI